MTTLTDLITAAQAFLAACYFDHRDDTGAPVYQVDGNALAELQHAVRVAGDAAVEETTGMIQRGMFEEVVLERELLQASLRFVTAWGNNHGIVDKNGDSCCNPIASRLAARIVEVLGGEG